MIPLIPKWIYPDSIPSRYDGEAKTLAEQTAKLCGAMNMLIEDYNRVVAEMNASNEEFKSGTLEEIGIALTAYRQEFQDFIDAVDIAYRAQEQRIENKIAAFQSVVDAAIADIAGSVDEVLNAEY